MAEMELTSAVVQSTKEDAYKGGSAAIIETLDTKGIPSIMPGVFPAVPKVTAGTLFSGIFEVDVKNTLNSTKFGVDFDKKPLSIKGYYKYTSGEKYYECADPSKSEIAIENSDLNNKDQFSISAYLYEYDPAQETKKKYSSYLTGVNIKTSDKVIAKKEFNGGNQLTYKEFTLPLEYTGKYEEGKNYRLAIVFSSSKDGDKFSGAPGSVLYVDDIEIVWE